MRKFLAFLGLVAILIFSSFFGVNTVKKEVKKDLAEPVVIPSPDKASIKPSVKGVREEDVKRSIFVPYWGIDKGLIEEAYNEYLYFGITPSLDGINVEEEGFINIKKFNSSIPADSKKKLVVRMIDSKISFPILDEAKKQDKVIYEAIDIAAKNNFKGIILDLEISAAPFDSLINQINQFTYQFYKYSKSKNIEFSIMFYGDTFHRIRPFDVKTLSNNADSFYIMSYDFSKSRGNPGPNFPLKGKEVYGYDMTEMTSDFLRFLPADRVTVVFGLFGYDWEVDGDGVALNQGKPLTYNQIKSDFLDSCAHAGCSARRKNDSRETEIRYKDDGGKDHIVWFEDEESIKEKEEYLRGQGIGSFSFWAHSYF